jgi:hypothetical protein
MEEFGSNLYKMKILNITSYMWYSFLEEKLKMLPKVYYSEEFGDLSASLFEVGITALSKNDFFLFLRFDIIMNKGVEILCHSTDLEFYNMPPSDEKDIIIFEKVVNYNPVADIFERFIYNYYGR